jgi:hypothetical protein
LALAFQLPYPVLLKGTVPMKRDFRPEILSILSKIKRPGMDNLITFLETSDFFSAPASTRFHLAYEGGLAEHSWNVYTIFSEKLKTYSLNFGKDSIALCGLLHDICKTNFYKRGKKNVKENGKWLEKEVWMVEDSLPFGHGEKSVYLLQKYIELSDEEALTIRWHMGFTESQDAWEQLRQAYEKYPAVMALHIADLEAAFLVESRGE